MALLAALLATVLCLSSQIKAQLVVGFYNSRCPRAESIIWEEVLKAFLKDKGIAPGLVRAHFHDCFVRGCDGSLFIDSTPTNVAEKDGPPNGITLRGLEVVDNAKARLEAECKGVVSCADILAYAARDSVVITGGRGWGVPAGRRDGRISRAAETIDIPGPFQNLDQITQAFAKKNMTQDEMIALSGAHTIGRSHCTSFSNRLYDFSPANSQDPSLDRFLAALLKIQCPQGPQGDVDPNLVVPMNRSPALFENSYYRDILAHRVVLTSDQTLITSPESLSEVREYAFNEREWQEDFADAMVKMSQIEVLTGTAGEIRSNCRVINP
nr:peroxidase 5-like [Coffea arabica]